jgi:hypothetical protein
MRSFFYTVIAGHIGIRFADQFLDLKRRLHSFCEQLELYSILAVQPMNYPDPMPALRCGDQTIEWISWLDTWYIG